MSQSDQVVNDIAARYFLVLGAATADLWSELPPDVQHRLFEQAVLRKTREIPRGEVRPYGWIAREIGRPAAMRAVGTALAPIACEILVIAPLYASGKIKYKMAITTAKIISR